MRWAKSIKRDLKKGAFCSFDEKSNLDLRDFVRSSDEEEK
jgi:hypothetical protein